jgi:phosphoribosyl 1,2-cyclic phosphodiesterase
VRSGGTAILIDAGISLKDLARRLSSIGVGIEELDALVLTHEHGDHVRGAIALCRRRGLRVHAGRTTSGRAGLSGALRPEMVVHFAPGVPFEVGCLEVLPFAVPHDAAETVGFRVSDGKARAGLATDLGSLTLEVLEGLSGCDVVVLESNHDEAMLLDGPYPPFLKRRVNGPNGHLSNADAAELIRCVCHDGLRHLALAHLSRTNNKPDLPLEAARLALGARAPGVQLSLGWQERAGEFIRI